MENKKEIEKLAKLARIDIPKEDVGGYAKDFDGILSFISQLKSANTKGEKEYETQIKNVFRPDTESHKKALYTGDVLENAAKKHDGYISCDKVIDRSDK